MKMTSRENVNQPGTEEKNDIFKNFSHSFITSPKNLSGAVPVNVSVGIGACN